MKEIIEKVKKIKWYKNEIFICYNMECHIEYYVMWHKAHAKPKITMYSHQNQKQQRGEHDWEVEGKLLRGVTGSKILTKCPVREIYLSCDKVT